MGEQEGLAKLAGLFNGLRTHSRFAMTQAFQAKEVAGLGATLIVQINPDPTKPPDVYFSTAPSSLVTDLWKTRG